MLDDIHLRSSQEKILQYNGGKMGISAVPGSGKTWTLSLLARQIILNDWLEDDQELLIVTLTNSAVDNFSQRIDGFLKKTGLLPKMGYRVRTLHGLANDIVHQRPELAGLDNQFQIVSETEVNSILDTIVKNWMNLNWGTLQNFLDPALDEGKINWIQRDQLPALIMSVAKSCIGYAKNHQITPQELRKRLDSSPTLPLAEIGYQIYTEYEKSLNYRGSVDFDDLIRLALNALQFDTSLLERMRRQFPYILEDEAQDSSLLQEKILRLLVGNNGNWVRVGDPNQAIFETFTTANPKYLRNFLKENGVIERQLPESGRSAKPIIDLANHLVRWTQKEHPLADVRDALADPLIRPVPANDPKPNPNQDQAKIVIASVSKKVSSDEELKKVIESLKRWLPNHSEETVAVLATINKRCYDLVDALEKQKIPYCDSLLKNTSNMRQSAGVLGKIIQFLAAPHQSAKLAEAYHAWGNQLNTTEVEKENHKRTAGLLRQCKEVETYIHPTPEHDWLAQTGVAQKDNGIYQYLITFREVVRRWQGTVLLPIDQIILTLAQDLFKEPNDLALAYKIARVLLTSGALNPEWQLAEFSEALNSVTKNQHMMLNFNDNESGFDPEQHKGEVVVSTMHKAKGLEWDRVYLMSVNNYDYPSGAVYDDYLSEKWFIRDHLNLEAETLRQFELLFSKDEYEWYEEGNASQQARLDYIRERLRLLFVGITRARKELMITWNTGTRGDLVPAVPFVELFSFWEKYRDESSATI